MGYSGFKGIGPNKIGAKKGGAVSPAKMYGGKKGDESKSKLDYESPAKQTAKQKKNLPKQIKIKWPLVILRKNVLVKSGWLEK